MVMKEYSNLIVMKIHDYNIKENSTLRNTEAVQVQIVL